MSRVANVDALDDILDAWFAARSSSDATAAIGHVGGAIGPVETVSSLLTNVQVVAREAIVEVADPEQGALRMTNVIPRFAGHARLPPRPGPVPVGGDTVAVLRRELGLTEVEIDALRRSGAFGSADPHDVREPPNVR